MDTEKSSEGMFMLYHLVYTSHATRPIPLDERIELVRAAARNNARRNVTGLLLYKDDRFIQLLEGDQSVVEGLMASLEADDRHEDVQVLDAGPDSSRRFPDWNMKLFNPERYSPLVQDNMATWFARAEKGERLSFGDMVNMLRTELRAKAS